MRVKIIQWALYVAAIGLIGAGVFIAMTGVTADVSNAMLQAQAFALADLAVGALLIIAANSFAK